MLDYIGVLSKWKNSKYIPYNLLPSPPKNTVVLYITHIHSLGGHLQLWVRQSGQREELQKEEKEEYLIHMEIEGHLDSVKQWGGRGGRHGQNKIIYLHI